jgi:hypothetical protein
MPVETNSAMSFYEKRTALGGIAVGEYELIDNPKAVTNYFTKWIDRDCEYDLFFSSLNFFYV